MRATPWFILVDICSNAKYRPQTDPNGGGNEKYTTWLEELKYIHNVLTNIDISPVWSLENLLKFS